MSVGDFIKNKFVGMELYISCGENAETITFSDSWTANKEFLFGTVLYVEDNVVALQIPNNGIIYINCDNIVDFWEPGLDYHKCVRTSLTRRLVGARRKDK